MKNFSYFCLFLFFATLYSSCNVVLVNPYSNESGYNNHKYVDIIFQNDCDAGIRYYFVDINGNIVKEGTLAGNSSATIKNLQTGKLKLFFSVDSKKRLYRHVNALYENRNLSEHFFCAVASDYRKYGLYADYYADIEIHPYKNTMQCITLNYSVRINDFIVYFNTK
ncbi:MAG: hypothetical protein J6I73_01480 [Treponema sp.]|nr:hypothetical protein [Treponema sp.]